MSCRIGSCWLGRDVAESGLHCGMWSDAHVVPLVPKVVYDIRTKGTLVRATTLLNRLLGFAGTVVTSFSHTANTMLVQIAMRSKALVCPCGRVSRSRYDQSRRSWRHLNLGPYRVVVEADVRRVDC